MIKLSRALAQASDSRDRATVAAVVLLSACCASTTALPASAQERRVAAAPPSDVRYVAGGNADTSLKIARGPAAGLKGEWRLPALDYANSRYSELDQVNRDNVSELKVVGTASTGIPK